MSKRVFSDLDDEKLVENVALRRFLYDREHDAFRNNTVKNEEWKRIADGLGKDVGSCKKRWKDIRDNYSKILRREDFADASSSAFTAYRWPLFDKLHFLKSVHRRRSTYCVIPKDFREVPSDDVTYIGEVDVSLGMTSQPSDPHSRDDDDPLILESDHFAVELHPGTTDVESVNSCESAEAFPTPKREPEDFFEDNARTRRLEVLQLQDILHKSTAYEEETDVDMFMRSVAMTVKSLPPHVIPVAKMEILSVVNRLQLQQCLNN